MPPKKKPNWKKVNTSDILTLNNEKSTYYCECDKSKIKETRHLLGNVTYKCENCGKNKKRVSSNDTYDSLPNSDPKKDKKVYPRDIPLSKRLEMEYEDEKKEVQEELSNVNIEFGKMMMESQKKKLERELENEKQNLNEKEEEDPLLHLTHIPATFLMDLTPKQIEEHINGMVKIEFIRSTSKIHMKILEDSSKELHENVKNGMEREKALEIYHNQMDYLRMMQNVAHEVSEKRF
jgi:hypothetical protein